MSELGIDTTGWVRCGSEAVTFARLTRSAHRWYRLRDAALSKFARWLDALAAQREQRRQTRTPK